MNGTDDAGLLILDSSGKVLSWDGGCTMLWRRSEADAIQAGGAALFEQSLPDAIGDCAPGGEPLRRDLVLRRGDGERMAAHCSIRRHSIAGQNVISIVVHGLGTDREASQSDLPWSQIVEAMPCLFYVIDPSARLLRWNRRLADALEITESAMQNADVLCFIDEPDQPLVAAKIAEAFSEGVSSHEAVVVGAGGKRTPCLFHCAATTLDGQACLFGTAIDISESKRHELRLLVNERAMDACVNAIIITRREGDRNVIEYVNPAFTRITGYSRADSLGRDPSFMQAGDMDAAERARIRQAVQRNESVHALVRNLHKDGTVFWNDLRISPVVSPGGLVTHSVAVIEDVTESLRAEEQLRHMATHDQLTGLANRSLFNDSLQQAIERTRREQGSLALMYVDLDNFKQINDTLGHEAGDRVLIVVAERLREHVRAGDTVARLGGDEFVAVLCDCKTPDQTADLVGRLHAALTAPMQVAGKDVFPLASIGVSVFPHDGNDVRSILRSADAAMYQAKSSGKNVCRFYCDDMDGSIHDYLARERTLRQGIERDELFLQYQPKVDLKSNKVVGAEVLVRWNHPENGIVFPGDFIGLAEESGAIVRLGQWVLERSCDTLKTIRRAGFADFSLSINLSARQLRQHDFLASVEAILLKHQVDHGALEFEVTESQLMDAPEQAASTLEKLKRLGLRLSIDDFGTGYSSLGYLRRFPVDYIKIDRSFLADLERNGDAVITQAIIALGHSLALSVVAEGVETPAQLDFLRDHHCDLMQGHYFSQALSQQALLHMLHSNVTMQ